MLNLRRLDQIVNRLSHHHVKIVERPDPNMIPHVFFPSQTFYAVTVAGTPEGLNLFEQGLNQLYMS